MRASIIAAMLIIGATATIAVAQRRLPEPLPEGTTVDVTVVVARR